MKDKICISFAEVAAVFVFLWIFGFISTVVLAGGWQFVLRLIDFIT